MSKKNLFEAPAGDYVVLEVSWDSMRIGKALHDRGIMYGVNISKASDSVVIVDDVRYELPDYMIKAISVLTPDEFSDMISDRLVGFCTVAID